MARFYGLVAACFVFALLAAAAGAMQFTVGGRRGWSVPDATAEPYNAWAGRMRFQIGDELLFVYPKETDSVLVVEQGGYDACNTSSWTNKFDDGSTVVTLDRSGPFFFVSGDEARCRAGEKLIVVVLADRRGRGVPTAAPPAPAPSISTPPSAAPAPSPPATSPSPSAVRPVPMPAAAPAANPSLAPSPAASSAPVPAPMATPSSPPSPSSSPAIPGGAVQPPSAPGAEGANSTTPPSSSTNDRSGAAPAVAGFATSLGACIAYAMLVI